MAVASEPMAMQPAKMGGACGYIIYLYIISKKVFFPILALISRRSSSEISKGNYDL